MRWASERAARARRRAASLIAAAALAGWPAPAGADGPAADPGPMPLALDPAAIRKLPLATLEKMARLTDDMRTMALRSVESNGRMARVEFYRTILIGKIPEGHRPPKTREFFDWGGEVLGDGPYTIAGYYELQSIYWLEVAQRYRRNSAIVRDAIAGAFEIR